MDENRSVAYLGKEDGLVSDRRKVVLTVRPKKSSPGPVRAMVMAAGAGTRLRPLTDTVPKPMVPIANRPVLEYAIRNLKTHGITDIILNLHSHPDQIRTYFKDGAQWGVNIQYSHEPKLLGTAGGVKNVENFLKGGTSLIMSGDGLTTIDLTRLIRFHRSHQSEATIGLKPLDSKFDYGVTLMKGGGRIDRFVEKPSWGDVFSNLVNSGIYVIEPSVLAMMPRGQKYDFGSQLWPRFLELRKPLYGYPMSEYWCDVGNLQEYRKAQRDFLDGSAGQIQDARQVRKGIWIADGAHVDRGATLEAPCLIGAESRIAKGTVIGAHTVIGRRSTVATGATLKQCVLWDDVVVGARAYLQNVVVTSQMVIHEGQSIYDGVVAAAVSR